MQILGQGAAPAAEGGDSLIKDGTDQSFMADVIEPSRQGPVIVDFWAPWCGPCRQLGPIIERAVRAAGGKVRLVKVNIDENPGVAGQLRIQSIPAVIAFVDGQPADGFMGALPESQVRDFIARLTGDQDAGAIETLIERGEAALAQNDLGGAAQDFSAALQADPENLSALGGLARVNLAGGQPDQAAAILDKVPEAKRGDPAVAGVFAALSLRDGIADASDPDEAARAVEADPKNPKARYELARALIATGDLAGATDELLEAVGLEREWNDGAARALLLKVFEAAGPGSELAKQGRRRLSSLLFA